MMNHTITENSTSEIVPEVHGRDGVRFYCGNSMAGVFCLGDRLLVKSVARFEVRPGDIVIFRKAYNHDVQSEVVHRVVSIRPLVCFTRGDNNLFFDFPPVSWEQVVGKVYLIERNGRRKVVIDGLPGLYLSKIRWVILLVKHRVKATFRRFYHALRQSGLVSIVWHPVIKKISLETGEGFLVKYTYNQRTVAVWNRTTQKFVCDKPFDLVISYPEDGC